MLPISKNRIHVWLVIALFQDSQTFDGKVHAAGIAKDKRQGVNTMLTLSIINVCTSCGRQVAQKTCPECNRETMAQDLIPTHCLDCGAPLALPAHLRTSLGQCEDCADQNPTIIGLQAWDALLPELL